MIGPRAVMPIVMANALPVAAPRWAGGKTSTRRAVPAGTNSAAPTPAMNRATNSSVDEPMRPDATARPAAARKMSRPALNMGTRPLRSPSHPPRVTSPASERNARFMTHWLAVIEMPEVGLDRRQRDGGAGRVEGPRRQGRSCGDQGDALLPGLARRILGRNRLGGGGRHASVSLSGPALRTGGAVHVPSRISARGR